jgi:hypothetical protein
MKKIYNFINKYKKEIIVILILIIISIGIYYFYYIENFINEGFFTTTTPITIPKWEQLGNDIDGEAADDYSGDSVSLSSDGTIVAIGAPYNDGGGYSSGHVRIYQYNGTSWEQLGNDIDGETAVDESGYSVSLSSDGTIVAIGAPYNDGGGSSSGHVRIYKYDGTSWGLLGQEIDGEAEGDRSGVSVSLSSDGTIVAIGAPYNDGGGYSSGHVRVYQYNGTSWEQLGNDIDGEAEYDVSGGSVSLSSDGTIVAIGAEHNSGDNGSRSGHVRIYQYNGTSWTQLGNDIDGETAYDYSGISVSLSSDGTIVAIGTPYNDDNGNNSGHVRIYKYDGTSWGLLGQEIDGEAASDRCGWSVSLSSDGTIVAIGAPGNNGNGSGSGHVRIYQYNGTSWEQLGNDIDGETADDESGYSVSLSSDGTIVAIGAYNNDGVNGQASGHVRIYKISPIDCVGDFVNDGVCSEPCGPGRQDQIYEIKTPAQFGGETCPNETGDTKVIDCNIQDCSPIDCVGEYQNSGECVANDPNLNCGPGTQQQEYRILQSAEHGGVCPVVATTIRSISCNLPTCPIDCEGSFGDFGPCSKDCVGGTHSRTYTITKDAQHEGAKCLHPNGYVDEKPCNTNIICPIDCVGEFVPFKDCSRECGGGMFQEIYNITTEAQHGGKSCSNKQNDLKTSDCNMDPCPTYPVNTTLQEALKESNNKIQNIRYNIIDRQEKLDTLTNKFNSLNKNISFLKHNKNYVPDDKTLTFY